jgi:diamine N-acetyltransferase
MISLRAITKDNYDECLKLKVAEDQKRFVATNVRSIADSKILPYLIPLAVYVAETMVGFTLHGKDPESKKYYIVRLMIDERFQGKGYGKRATLKLIEKMGNHEDCDAVYLYFVSDNFGAEKLYTNLGFEKTGVIDEEYSEIEMRLDLKHFGAKT